MISRRMIAGLGSYGTRFPWSALPCLMISPLSLDDSIPSLLNSPQFVSHLGDFTLRCSTMKNVAMVAVNIPMTPQPPDQDLYRN